MELNQTSYVILGILAIHPDQSGYEIRKTVQQSVGFFWGESFGQIYPTLKRLASDGLIAASKPAVAERAKASRAQKSGAKKGGSQTKGAISGRARQEYSVTAAGKLGLQQWLAVPFRDDPPRDEFLLKMFFANEAGTRVALEQVARFKEKNRRMLATLEELQKLSVKHSSHYPGFPYWMLTLDYGVRQLRAGLEWSDNAAQVLKALERPKKGRGRRKHV
jgi:PadR family transcriptional regulator AphA